MSSHLTNAVGARPATVSFSIDKPRRLVSFPRDGHATANGVLSDYFTRTVSAAECAVNSGAYMHWMVARPPENVPRCCTR